VTIGPVTAEADADVPEDASPVVEGACAASDRARCASGDSCSTSVANASLIWWKRSASARVRSDIAASRSSRREAPMLSSASRRVNCLELFMKPVPGTGFKTLPRLWLLYHGGRGTGRARSNGVTPKEQDGDADTT
jgi:hypothetical protein